MAPLERPQPAGRPDDPAQAPLVDEVARLRSAVAGLASEVESVRRGMRTVASTGELARVATTVADLTEVVSTIQSVGGGKQRESDVCPSWLTLRHEFHDARAILSDLTAWLRDVYLRYADAARELPECWLWHPDIVEELVWLMYAWLAAYRDDDTASIRAAADWHDRLRPGVVRRIHAYARTCSLENHLPGRPNATGAPHVPVVDDDSTASGALGAIAAWWTDDRDQPGPVPTDDQMTAAAAATRLARTGTAAQAFSPISRVPRRTDLNGANSADSPNGTNSADGDDSGVQR